MPSVEYQVESLVEDGLHDPGEMGLQAILTRRGADGFRLDHLVPFEGKVVLIFSKVILDAG